jgi:phosphatidylglycerophosphatase C
MTAKVDELIARLVTRAAPRPIVFDADGTLWRGDVGEDFLRYLTFERQVPADAWRRYEAMLQVDHARAYALAVEVMEGLAVTHLQTLANAFFAARFSGRIHRPVRAMLERLRAVGYQPWICSASPVWAVMPGGAVLDIPPERVIGVASRIDDQGALTREIDAPVCCGPGKVSWLRRHLGPERPALAVGNGELDLEMLLHADEALVVAPLDGPDNRLVAEAVARGWPVLRA